MFLVDSATHAIPNAMTLLATVRKYGPAIYEGLLKPMPRKDAIYLGLSDQIKRTSEYTTVEERRQMHQYVSCLLKGNTDVPPWISESLACQVRGMMVGEENHFHRLHPLQDRLAKAAA